MIMGAIGSAKNQVYLGYIAAVWGVKGEVRLVVFSDDPRALVDLSPFIIDGSQISFASVRAGTKNRIIAKIKGICDREAAARLVGAKLFVDRSRLTTIDDDNVFYRHDLLNLKVMTIEGEDIGRVSNVVNYGGGDLLELSLNDGGQAMVSFSRHEVPSVVIADDHSESYIIIDRDMMV